MLQSSERRLCAAGLAFLYGRAWHGRVGTVDAAVPFQRFQHRVAGRAFIEPLTRIRWHRFFRDMSALGTGENGLKDYFVLLLRHRAYPVRMRKPARIVSALAELVANRAKWQRDCPTLNELMQQNS